MRHCTFCAAMGFFLCWLMAGRTAEAYPVPFSLSLKKLIEEADVIVKATAVSSEPVEDGWFGEVRGFAPHQTQLKVIAVFKGATEAETISFRHFASIRGPGADYMPQHYEFVVGRTYIVFAKRAEDNGVFRQIWKNHRCMEDQGLLLAADTAPHAGKSVAEVLWAELTGLLKSRDAGDVKYAISRLDWLSGGSYDRLNDFDRRRVLKAILPLAAHENEEIAQAAILALGSRNPYLLPDYAPSWLGTIGSGGPFPGMGQWDLPREYLGGKLFCKELAAVADGKASASIRALAIRALGRAQRPEIFELAGRWVHDREPAVRQAAAILLADYSERVDRDLLKQLAADSSPLVRMGAAHAIGFGQMVDLVPLLGELVRDPEPKVATAAGTSLLSFSLKHSREILEAHVDHPQFRSVFVNALARDNPRPDLEALGDIVRNDLRPENWWGGRVPWGVSWEILFRYAQRQSAARLKSGDLDGVLDALESPVSGSPKSPRYYSSSEPRDLYALYLQRGMAERAQRFRAKCKAKISYDIDQYFKMVDRNPSIYQRN